jgi:hypothetical protein
MMGSRRVSRCSFDSRRPRPETHSTLPVVRKDRLQKVLVRVVVVLSDVVLDGLGSVPSGVVGDLAGYVVGDVGLADPVQDVLADRAEEFTVESAQSALGESPLLGRVVSCERMGSQSVSSEQRPNQAHGDTHATGGRCAEQR